MKCKLGALCSYVKEKVKTETLDKKNYISTENMLSNKGGITLASSLPSTEYTSKYQAGDILISNIRPYFKKIWKAEYDGGCSNDVLVLRANDDCYIDFLYYALASDSFFDYATATAKGTKIVRIVQEKTGNSVVIPILNDNLLHIAEKYNYEIPKVNGIILNRYIKQILKELSETVPTLARLERTVLTMKERAKEERGEVSFMRDAKGYVVKPRYDLVSSHTARRSGITNLYLTGLFDSFQMMSVSGHKDEKTFNEYIKLSSDEIADAIAKKLEERNRNKSSNEGLF